MANQRSLYHLQTIINRNTERIIRPKNAGCSSLVDREMVNQSTSLQLPRREQLWQEDYRPEPQKQKYSMPVIKRRERINTVDDRAYLMTNRIIKECENAVMDKYTDYRIKQRKRYDSNELSIMRADMIHQRIKRLIFESVQEGYEVRNKLADHYVRDFSVNINKSKMLSDYKKRQLKGVVNRHKQSKNREDRMLKIYTQPN